MAAISLEQKLVIEYRNLVATQRVEDFSDPQDEETGENTDRTQSFARMAGAKIRSFFDVEEDGYDDTDPTVGDLEIVDLGTRWMTVSARSDFGPLTEEGSRSAKREIIEEMIALQEMRLYSVKSRKASPPSDADDALPPRTSDEFVQPAED